MWKYIIVGLGCLWGVILFVLISGLIMFFAVNILLWIGFFIGLNFIVIIIIQIMILLYMAILLLVALLAFPYTIICIFDCIKNNISTISSISKHVELGLSNKKMIFFISMSVILFLGGSVLLNVTVFTSGSIYTNIVLGSILYYGYILILHFIFTQLEAKYEIQQKELDNTY